MLKLKTFLYFSIYIIIISLLCSLISYFNIITFIGIDKLVFILMNLFFLYVGIKFGLKSTYKGFKEGLKISLSLLLVLIFMNLLFFRTNYSISKLIYYMALILSGSIGGIIGINNKKV